MGDPAGAFVGFALERAWGALVYLARRARSGEPGWERLLADDIAATEEGLLDGEERDRFEAWLREAPWDRLADAVEGDIDHLVEVVDRDVYRTWQAAPGTDPAAWAAAHKERARRLVAALVHRVFAHLDPAAAIALGGDIVQRRGRRALLDFMQVLADDHVALHLQGQEIQDALRRLLDAGAGASPFVPEPGLLPAPFPAPSLLLRAQYGVVPFLFRDDEMAEIQQWAAEAPSPAVCVVTGRGGLGKTRLGLELCRWARGRGWTTGFLSPTAPPEAVSRLEGDSLVVVDYAETRPDQVALLLEAFADGARGDRGAVVLLVRAELPTAEDVIARLGAHRPVADALLAQAKVVALAGPPDSARDALYREATVAFARALGRTPVDIPVPRFEEDAGDNTLLVTIAALASVLEGEDWQRQAGATTTSQLLRTVPRHEAAYWARTAEARGLDIDDTIEGRAVAVATLMGADAEQEAVDLLRLVPDLADSAAAYRHRVARWLHDLYPGVGSYLGALEPDLMGEELVRQVIADVPDLARRVLATAGAPRLTRALTVLGRAAQHHPETLDIVAGALDGALEHLVEIAVKRATGPTEAEVDGSMATALATAVRTAPVLPSTALRIRRPFDMVTLFDLNLALDERVVEGSAPFQEHLSEKAQATFLVLHARFATGLGFTGKHDQALAVAERAVSLARRLYSSAAIDIDEVGVALGALGGVLVDAGREAEAQPVFAEAADLLRRASEKDPEALTMLAAVQRQLAWITAAAGNHEEGLALAEEAVDLARRSASDSGLLAANLGVLGDLLVKFGQVDEGLRVTDEALALHRRLAAEDWQAFLPALAFALGQSAGKRYSVGRLEEAFSHCQEALAIRRRLAERHPAAYRQDMCTSLELMTRILMAMERPQEAVIAGDEAVVILRELTVPYPALFAERLRDLLDRLGALRYKTGRPRDALTAMNELVDLLRPLVAHDIEAADDYVHTLLNVVSLRLNERLGSVTDLVDAIDDAFPAFVALVRASRTEHNDRMQACLDAVDACVRTDGTPEERKRWEAITRT